MPAPKQSPPSPPSTNAQGGDEASWYPIPPLSSIPKPPPGYPKNAAKLRGVKPRQLELVNLAQVVAELRAFDGYAEVFGAIAPPRDGLIQSLDAAQKWSAMRVAIADWDDFCATQEGLSWQDVRAHLKQLRPAFDLALVRNANLQLEHVSLAHLLGAMKAIVRKGVATKAANKKAVEEGREPVRGKKLKAARRAEEKAALAAQLKKKENEP
jgi:hypothetical protein